MGFKRTKWTWQAVPDTTYRSDHPTIDTDINPAPRGGDIANGENASGTFLGSADSDIFIFANSNITAVGGAGDDIFDMYGGKVTIRAGTGADIVTVDQTYGLVDLGKDKDGDLVIVSTPGDGLLTVRNFNPDYDILTADWAHITARHANGGTYLDYDGGSFVFLAGVRDFEI